MRRKHLLSPHLGRSAALAASAVLVVLLLAVAFIWWGRSVEDRLGRRATDEIARATGGTYRLKLSDPSFLPLSGSIAFDSAVVTTDSARNRRRGAPLPVLEGTARGCRLSGLDIVRLLLRRSFVARELGCDRVAASIALVSPAEEGDPAPDTAGPAAPGETPDRPLGLSKFRIADVVLPELRFTLWRPGARGGTSIHLEHARFEAKDLVFDPTADARSGRLSADRARLAATGLVLRPDTLIELAIARAEAELTDSILRLAGAKHEPATSKDERVHRVKGDRDRVRFELDSLLARGVAYRAFVATGDIRIRALELRGARLDVLTDTRIPRGPPSRRRTPQQVVADSGPALRLDSVVVRGGRIVYRERKPGRARAGWVSFDAVRATVLGLARPPRATPLRIEAAARLMDAGPLTVEATVPLDAPDFRYRLSGRLGRMPAEAFNRFLSENEPFEFESGLVEGITFRQTVKGGRALTTLTPRYRDLSVETTGEGGGLVGSVRRAVEEFVADAFVVRSRNPEEDGEKLRTARTVRRYNPASTWIQFLWFGLREGLREVLKE